LTYPLTPSSDHLALLYRLSQTFNSSLDLEEVLNQVLDEVIAVTHAERGFLMLHEPDGRPAFKIARGIDRATISEPSFQVSRGIIERVAQRGQPVLITDAQIDDQSSVYTSVMSLGLRSILCVPMHVKGKPIGLIYVDNRLRSGIFTQTDVELLSALAASAAIAIENARLYQIAFDKGQLEKEYSMARKIQEDILPRKIPSVPGWQLDAYWQPAQAVSGDFYDFMVFPDGRLGLAVGDVSGKGIPAALVMATTCTILRATAKQLISPAEVLAAVNSSILADIPENMFVTCLYAVLDPTSGNLQFANAGHVLPYLLTPFDLVELRTTGMPLGLLPEMTYDEKEASISAGDSLVLISDGMIEAHNPQRDMFGLERMRTELINTRGRIAAIEFLLGRLEEFTGCIGEQEDDVTFLTLQRL
jgi:serine phosphatase RsbU (regulator of sigma subunit)